MDLNTLSPGAGSQQKSQRVGRGMGSGRGKTCGRGHKGQKARSNVPAGFEGGQMPLHRRIPKWGFVSRIGMYTTSLPLSAMNALDPNEFSVIDLDVLKRMGLVAKTIKRVRVFLSGEITKKHNFKGIHFTKGAKKAATALGCKVDP